METALKLLQAADSILLQLTATAEWDEFELGRIHLLTMLNLQGLIGLGADAQRSEEGVTYYDAFCRQREDFLERESIFPWNIHSTRAAAVA